MRTLLSLTALYCSVKPFFEEGKMIAYRKPKGAVQHSGISV